MIFFKRYFLKKLLINNDPKQIALSCLYLACKVEEMRLDEIAEISDELKKTVKEHDLKKEIHSF